VGGETGEGNGEVIAEKGSEADERKDWSEETVETECSPVVSAVPAAPQAAPVDDTPPPKVLPDDRQQSGIPSGRFDGEGIAPSPFSEGGTSQLDRSPLNPHHR
jgi:hypothetical protein